MAFLCCPAPTPRHRMDHMSPVLAGVMRPALNLTAFPRREHRRGRGRRSPGRRPTSLQPLSAIKLPRVPRDNALEAAWLHSVSRE